MAVDQGAPRLRTDHAVRRQPVTALKADHRRGRRRSGDSVDRAAVDVVVPERHLQPGDRRAAGGRRAGRRNERDGDREREQGVTEACHPSPEGSAGMAKS